jgi:SAM-dependent methyltransferase
MPIYSDSGNAFVADRVPPGTTRILDVGCGCGDTAALIKRHNPDAWIEGITFNPIEATRANAILDRVHTFDIEHDPPIDLNGNFDCILFSHILEHLREPAAVILRFLSYLIPGGTLIVAVPNVLEWRTRLKFARGQFVYTDYGILDRTHLKFFTFDSADYELMSTDIRACVTVVEKLGDGAIPLGPLRRLGFMQSLAKAIDGLGVSVLPNLFSQQVVIIARKAR